RAMSLLKSGGYVISDEDGFLFLTESGKQVAEKMFERHTLITKFLCAIGVDEDTAVEDACKMEHVISDVSFEAIKRHAERHLRENN
ncbi:MAG: metal-dependent transcriptional regulator, partial [Oscillospiraceae bacterium]|nr:metal-dependent transcriptional regulator [Oscillospiraceae bacterium]